jgi:hypothetical protein
VDGVPVTDVPPWQCWVVVTSWVQIDELLQLRQLTWNDVNEPVSMVDDLGDAVADDVVVDVVVAGVVDVADDDA